jgi:hypothetical protein
MKLLICKALVEVTSDSSSKKRADQLEVIRSISTRGDRPKGELQVTPRRSVSPPRA